MVRNKAPTPARAPHPSREGQGTDPRGDLRGPGLPQQPQGRPGLSPALLGLSQPVGLPARSVPARRGGQAPPPSSPPASLARSVVARQPRRTLCFPRRAPRGRPRFARQQTVCPSTPLPEGHSPAHGPRLDSALKTTATEQTTGTAASGHSPRPWRSQLTGNGNGLGTGAGARRQLRSGRAPGPGRPLRNGVRRPAQPGTARLDSAQRHSPP